MSASSCVPNRPDVVLLNDWFTYYLGPIASALAQRQRVLCITRDHGLEFGIEGPAPVVRQTVMDGVPCRFVPGGPLSLRGAWAVIKIAIGLLRNPPVVVHSQEHSDWRLLVLSLVPPRAPRIVTVHDVTPHPGAQFRNHPLKKLVRRALYRSADVFILHGRSLVDDLRSDPRVPAGATIEVVPHGILAHPVGNKPLPDRPTVLFFGRWEYYKGLDVLIRAAELAAERVPHLRVIVAGEGPEAARCRAIVRKHDLFEWKQGFVKDDELPELFGACSAVALPYREASQSGVVPLAFANGRPVIASKVGALPEVIDHGSNGLLVDPDDVSALASCIERIFGTAHLLETLAAGASATAAAELTPERVAARHADIYQRARTPRRRRQGRRPGRVTAEGGESVR